MFMLPIGVDCPGCEDKEKEYFVSAGSKGMLNNIYLHLFVCGELSESLF